MTADGLGGPRKHSIHVGKIAVSDRTTLRVLTQFFRADLRR